MRIESKALFDTVQKLARDRNAERRSEILVCCGTGVFDIAGHFLLAQVDDDVAQGLPRLDRGEDAQPPAMPARRPSPTFCRRPACRVWASAIHTNYRAARHSGSR